MRASRQLAVYDDDNHCVVVLAKCPGHVGLLPGQIGWYEVGRFPLSDAPEPSDEDWDSVDRKLGDEIKMARGTPEFERYQEAIELRQATLAQVRKAQRLTQRQLADQLGLSQAQVSRIESADVNIMLSTLAKFIEATGGKLSVTATYPGDEPVELLIRDEGETSG